MRRTVKLLGLVVVAACAAACTQQPLPSKTERIAYLKAKGVTVEEPVNEIGEELHFRFGRCNAMFRYIGSSRDVPVLDLYYDKSYPIGEFIGEVSVGNAGKNAKTMFCLQKDLSVPSESE